MERNWQCRAMGGTFPRRSRLPSTHAHLLCVNHVQRNHGKKNGHFNRYVIQAPLGAPVQSTWEMNGVKGADGKMPGHKTVVVQAGETNWWDVKTKQTDRRGLPVMNAPPASTLTP